MSLDFEFPKHLSRKIPTQTRSKQRTDLIIEATEEMLMELAVEEISIPEIAKKTGISKASIYQFFPNKYILLNYLTEIHITTLMNTVLEAGEKWLSEDSFGVEHIQYVSKIVADYYNTHPITAKLVFSGPVNKEAYLGYYNIVSAIGRAFFNKFGGEKSQYTLPEKPDILAIAIELSFTTMKHGYYLEGYISDAICDQSSKAVYGYITVWLMTQNQA